MTLATLPLACYFVHGAESAIGYARAVSSRVKEGDVERRILPMGSSKPKPKPRKQVRIGKGSCAICD